MSRISVRVIPNASTSEVVGREGQTWKIRLAAPAIEGKANEALVRFLADVLDLAPSNVNIVKGQTSKQKLVEVPMHLDDVNALLESRVK